MENRAKCTLCQSVIQSFHATDFVACKCGEIFVDGGEAMKCGAGDWKHFLRVDDQGHEIPVTLKAADISEKAVEEGVQETPKPSKQEMLSMLRDMIKSIENLPDHAKLLPITHYDFASGLLLLHEILSDGT